MTGDFFYAIRSLRRSLAFTAVAVLTLSVGIGANAAVLGIFDALLVRPPEGVGDPAAVVRVQAEVPDGAGGVPRLDATLTPAHLESLRRAKQGFAGVAGYATATTLVGEGGSARNGTVVLASGEYFRVLRVGAALGRVTTPDDDRPGVPEPSVVLSWAYWKGALGGDPRVLGQRLRLGSGTFTVVGVAPSGFVGVELGSPAAWVPISAAPSFGYDESAVTSPHVAWLSLVGRVAEGASPARARGAAQAALLAAEAERASAPRPTGLGRLPPGAGRVSMSVQGPGGAGSAQAAPPRVRLAPLGGTATDGPEGEGPVRLWYLGVAAAVLLIACANVATLLMARAVSRMHEIATRVALGATPGRIARQLLAESVVLAVAGGVGGVAVGAALWRLAPAVARLPPLPSFLEGRTLGITAVVATSTVLLFGLAPLAALLRADLRALVGAAGPTLSARVRGKGVLVAGQITVSTLLALGAAMFVRGFDRVRDLELGFEHEQLLVVSPVGGGDESTGEDFWAGAAERLARVPGVGGVSVGDHPPFTMRMIAPFGTGSTPTGADTPPSQIRYVDPGFFRAFGIPVREGRPLGEEDDREGFPVAVVSQSFARQHFGAASAVGRCLTTPFSGACIYVVGVAADARLSEVDDEAPSFVYRPLPQRELPLGAGPGVLFVRTADPERVAPLVRQAIESAAPSRRVQVRPVSDFLEAELRPWRSAALLLSGFALVGLSMAAVGLYAVISYLVARRTREIGIRVALGAGRRVIAATVLRDSALLVLVGGACAVPLALAAGRLAGAILYGVEMFDPLVYVAVAFVLGGVAALASVFPVQRALRVDPMVALRTD